MRDYEVDIQGAAGKLGKLLRAVDDKKRELAKVSASLAVAQERGDADVPDVAHTAANASAVTAHDQARHMRLALEAISTGSIAKHVAELDASDSSSRSDGGVATRSANEGAVEAALICTRARVHALSQALRDLAAGRKAALFTACCWAFALIWALLFGRSPLCSVAWLLAFAATAWQALGSRVRCFVFPKQLRRPFVMLT